MLTKRLSFILIVCCIISCNKNPNILVDVHEMDFKNKTSDIIHGHVAIQDIPGANNILQFDTLLLVFTSNPSGQLRIYNSFTMDYLGSFCQEGRAKNEFTKALPTTNQIFFNDKGHIILPLVNSPDELKEVDITESLVQGHTVVLSTRECLRFNKGVVIYLNNNFDYKFEFIRNKYEANEEKTGVPSVYTLIEPSGKKKKLKIFSAPMDVSSEKSEAMPYSGTLYKHPSRNIVVQNFSYMEYLLFFDFDSENRFAIHQKDALSFNDTFDRRSRNESYVSFSDASTTNNYLLFLYWRGDYFLNVPNRKGNNEVLIFDWDGNYISGFKLDRQLSRIEYDEINHTLFGLDSNETIYAYDLEGILP